MCSLKFIKIQIKTVLIKTLAVTKIVFFVHGPKRTGQHTWQRAKLVFVTGLHWYEYISSYTNKKVQYYVQKVELLNMKRIWVIEHVSLNKRRIKQLN